jgi:hypothetical protein
MATDGCELLLLVLHIHRVCIAQCCSCASGRRILQTTRFLSTQSAPPDSRFRFFTFCVGFIIVRCTFLFSYEHSVAGIYISASKQLSTCFNMSFISPNVTHQPLPYHEVSAARLPALTISGLQAAGIPLEALGLRVGRRTFLTSCFTFSSYAQEILPPSLGGENIDAESRLSPPSKKFLAAASATAPSPDKRILPAYLSDLASLAPPIRLPLVPEVHAHDHHLSERYRLEGGSGL